MPHASRVQSRDRHLPEPGGEGRGNLVQRRKCLHDGRSVSLGRLRRATSTLTCPMPVQCHVQASCHASTGLCPEAAAKPDGTSCDDGNACTSGESCHSGTCGQPASTVACPAPDACHVQATCNASTGLCGSPAAKPDDSACDDGNACTSGESCHSGVCGSPSSTVAGLDVHQRKTSDRHHAAPVARAQRTAPVEHDRLESGVRRRRTEHLPLGLERIPGGAGTGGAGSTAGFSRFELGKRVWMTGSMVSGMAGVS